MIEQIKHRLQKEIAKARKHLLSNGHDMNEHDHGTTNGYITGLNAALGVIEVAEQKGNQVSSISGLGKQISDIENGKMTGR